ncbi:hypothetical protein B005_5444 [Nocardiopsis alba ATCC BAA-2165]|uniref:Uncharacterized protein n=1 Tax=Nocardiopsis alba (strain ATCC BAA-2165 / BE74) TaxID=1205910 RepID=J7LHP5_NOCAA|nr:hypothetical protein B005_5444 [Nocardiopsis alba ATCC BAA-2165]
MTGRGGTAARFRAAVERRAHGVDGTRAPMLHRGLRRGCRAADGRESVI